MRTLTLTLSLIGAVSLIACGDADDSGGSDTTQADTQAETTADVPPADTGGGDTTGTPDTDASAPGDVNDAGGSDVSSSDIGDGGGGDGAGGDTVVGDVGGGDVTDDVAADATPPPNAPAIELTQVWIHAIDAPDTSLTRLNTIATALGLSGSVTEDPEGVRMETSELGPVGPLTLQLRRLQFNLGDVRFFSSGDPTLMATITGSVASSGALTITGIDLPTIETDLMDGRVLTTTIALSGPSTGAVDLATGGLALALDLKAVVTCAGTGCFSGSCDVDLGTVAPDNSFSPGGIGYQLLPAPITLTASIETHAVESCTDGGTDQTAVAEMVGVDGQFVFARFSGDVELAPALAEDGKSLFIDARSGAVSYATPEGAQVVARTLPDDATAETQATAVLTSAGLLPPNALVSVRRVETPDEQGEREVQVRFMPRLELGTHPTEGVVTVPVMHAAATVRLGEGGAVLGLSSNWRPATKLEQVAAVPYMSAWDDVGGELVKPHEAQIIQRYGALAMDQAQSHYDPLWVVLDDADHLMSVTAGTAFMPRLDVTGHDVNELVPEGSPVAYTASATGGEPPYTFSWRSTVDGDLATGEALSMMLSPGPHTIFVKITDANGAGYEVPLSVQVAGPNPAASLPQGPTAPTTGSKRDYYGGASFIVAPRPKRVGPGIIMRDALKQWVGGTSLLQWRYKMKVTYMGTQYSIWSGPCRDGTTFENCGFPGGIDPSFVWYDKDASKPLFKNGRMAQAVGLYRDVPGTLFLSFAYQTGRYYAGPPVTGIDIIGAWVGGLGTKIKANLGGSAPGYLPMVAWGYKPPTGNGANACNRLAFISSHYENYVAGTGDPEDVGWTDLPSWDQIRGTDCPANGYDIPFTVDEIEIRMYHLTMPSPQLNHYTTLITDNGLPGIKKAFLQATDGGKDCTKQPAPWLGDAFCDILPVAVEKTVTVATKTGPGTTDNYHAKGAPSPRYVIFPGCNDPTDLVGADSLPCLHIHERWFDRPIYSKHQDVKWHLLKLNNAELGTEDRPETFVDNDVIGAGKAGVRQVHIHDSTATSADCSGGGVDNSGSPCNVFMSPVFGTH